MNDYQLKAQKQLVQISKTKPLLASVNRPRTMDINTKVQNIRWLQQKGSRIDSEITGINIKDQTNVGFSK